MNTTENKRQTINIDEAIQTVAARVKAEYSVSLEEGEPIRLYVDGLCENPGAMHIGLFARQRDQCLFAEHMFVGHGTCNEAEYLALKCGLRILQEVYPQPTLAIPATITGADIKNVAPLVEKFRSSMDEISAFFSAKLPNAVKRAPASTEPGPELDAFKGRLTAEFNAIIHSQPIYNVPMLSGIILRPATQQFLDQNPQGMALARLNRLVLEDACPADIQPKAPVQTFSDSQLVTKQIAGLWHAKDKM
jgi:hypothetical protein